MKADLFAILDKFVVQATLLNDFDDSWHEFMKRFAASVQHITGQPLDVKSIKNHGLMDGVEEEMEALRVQVDILSDEVCLHICMTIRQFHVNSSSQRTELRNELNQQIAELNTLKSLPLGIPIPNSRNPGKSNEVKLAVP